MFKKIPKDAFYNKIETIFYEIFLLILLISLIILNFNTVFIERLWPDEALYAWYGQQIYQNPGFIFSEQLAYPPLFPALLALGHFFLPSEQACRLVPIIFYVAGIILIFALGIKLKNKFVGTLCAVLLAFNFIYYAQRHFILIDLALSVLLILFAIALIHASEVNTPRSHVYVGLAGAAIAFLKWSSLLIIPWIIIFYLYGLKEGTLKQRMHRLITPLTIIIIAYILLMTKNYMYMGRLFPSTTALKGVYFTGNYLFYIRNSYFFIPLFLCPIFLAGFFTLLKEKRSSYASLVPWFIIFFTSISFVPEKTGRYALLVIPCVILITALALNSIINFFFKTHSMNCIIKIYIVCILFYIMPQNPLMIISDFTKSNSYIGFQEAGQWLSQNVREDTKIYVGSDRALRYTSGFDYSKDGGNIYRIPKNKDKFLQEIKKFNTDTFLVIDFWEYTQPGWIYPLTLEKINDLKGYGFNPVKVVQRKLFKRGEAKIQSVVLIFKYPVDL